MSSSDPSGSSDVLVIPALVSLVFVTSASLGLLSVLEGSAADLVVPAPVFILSFPAKSVIPVPASFFSFLVCFGVEGVGSPLPSARFLKSFLVCLTISFSRSVSVSSHNSITSRLSVSLFPRSVPIL
jgi:hypothetical protein